MFTSLTRLCNVGSVTRRDGAIVEGVVYDIRAHTQWLRNLQTTQVRLQVPRPEAMYWFLESGAGLRLNLADGRSLRFDLAGMPDHSGWVGVSAKYVVHPERTGKNGVARQPFHSAEAPDEAPS